MLFLVNPPRKKGGRVAKRRKKATRRRRKLTAAQIRAGFGGKQAQAALKGKRRRKRAIVARTRTRKRKGARTVAKRRKRQSTARRSTRRRRRSTGGTIRFRKVPGSIYRKNPGLPGGRIVRDIVDGAQGAAAVIAGKVAARMVGNMLPLPKTTVVGNIGTQIVSAVVVGMIGKRFLPAKFGDYVLVGALTAPVEAGLRLVPGVGGMLGEDPFLPVGEDPFLPMGSYPMFGSYPEGVGEEAVEAAEALGY